MKDLILEYLGQSNDPQRVVELLSESSKSDLARSKRELKKLAGWFHISGRTLSTKKSLLNEVEFGDANIQRRDERAKAEIRLAELREQLANAGSAKENTSSLPDQIGSFVKSFESL